MDGYRRRALHQPGSEVNLTLTTLARLCEGLEVDAAQLLKPLQKGR